MTTGVKDREPQGKLVAAGAGERAYAHLAVRNRRSDEERISVRFLVAGDERTTVDLTVKRSWQYRTWAYVTPRRGDAGKKLEVEVRDASGALLASTSLPIEATKRVTEQKAEWEEKGEER
jgi:hypothetical protein